MGDKKVIAECSLETQMIYDRLSRAEVGEIISYKELNEKCGRDTQKEGRGNLTTARRRCQRENNMVFGVVMRTGVKRLDDLGIVDSGHLTLDKMRRLGRREGQRQSCVNFDKLTNEKKFQYNLQVSIMGAVVHFTRPDGQKRVGLLVAGQGEKIPVWRLLEAFNSK